jgi:hypothetical protein
MPDETGEPVVTNSRVFYTTREAAGASDTRHSLRPLFSEGHVSRKARAINAARMRSHTLMLFEILNLKFEPHGLA